MPHSLVINVIPKSPIYPNYLTGRHLHALFLTLVSSVDKPLADSLHASSANKAFTLSPLQTNKSKHSLQWEHQQLIPAGTPCWWRIALLDDTLFAKLTQLWLNLNPKHPWHLGSADLYITSILGTPQSTQPWANATTYAQLYEQASNSNRELAFRFYTPTCFRQGEFDAALPTRDCVFNSLLNRWQKYSGIYFNSAITSVIFPSYFNISTTMITDSRSKFLGCVGDITYQVLGEVEPVVIKQINTLADFALYCGVGKKTTMGMGMMQRIRQKISERR